MQLFLQDVAYPRPSCPYWTSHLIVALTNGNQVILLLLGTIGCTIACSITIVIPVWEELTSQTSYNFFTSGVYDRDRKRLFPRLSRWALHPNLSHSGWLLFSFQGKPKKSTFIYKLSIAAFLNGVESKLQREGACLIFCFCWICYCWLGSVGGVSADVGALDVSALDYGAVGDSVVDVGVVGDGVVGVVGR